MSRYFRLLKKRFSGKKMLKVGAYFITITAILLLNNHSIFSQETKTSIKVLSRALPDSILLRWAPDNYFGWDAGNKYGYQILRYTLVKNGELIPNVKPEVLTPVPIKPLPLNQWENLANTDDYAGIAAQAIYGKTFELTNTKSTSILEVVNKVKEQDSRFSFALFAADMSPVTAKASGLWFTDKNVKKNEKYLYRIFLMAPKSVIIGDTGIAYTGIDEHLPLPKPLNVNGEFGDKSVIIHWDRKTLNYYYNSYDVERSDDGIKFAKLNKQPIVYANTGDFDDAAELMYIDSIVNSKKLYYRILGHNAFGETSPPSEIINGLGIMEIKAVPEINEPEDVDGKFKLTWTFPENENERIKGFKVVRSRNHATNFDTISGLLKPEIREYLDLKPLPTNYYKIIVVGKNGKTKNSVPLLAQLIDSIPPAIPSGLRALADTTGKLTLSWKPNKDEDIYGYRIYRANAANEEYSQITSEPIKDTFFVDHINLKTLTTRIYYQLMAIDKRQNHSDFSEPLEVERPDIVPPAPPALTGLQSAPGGVYIKWENSTSFDVVKHFLYRRTSRSNTEIVKEFLISDTTKTFFDNSGLENTRYYYSLVAIDKSGLKSIPTDEMAGEKLDAIIKDSLTHIRYSIDRKNFTITLSWAQPSFEVQKYIIYRRSGDGNRLSVYATIMGSKPEFIDKKLKADTKYGYLIKPIPLKSTYTSINKEVIVLF